MRREAIVFIKHILDSMKHIGFFMKDVSEENFLSNVEKQSAVIRQLEIIGEAVKNLPINFKNKYSEIPWGDIAKTRDKIIHHYFGVDLDTVFGIIKKDLPKLKKQIEEILEKEK